MNRFGSGNQNSFENTNDTTEQVSPPESLPEVEESTEDFDDCKAVEQTDQMAMENTDQTDMETPEEDFEDCGSNMEGGEEKASEVSEDKELSEDDGEDFDDCAKVEETAEAEPEVTEEPEAEVEAEPEVTEEPEAEVEAEPEVTEEPEAEVTEEAGSEVTEEPEAEVETEPEVTEEPEAEVETDPEVTEEPEAEVEAEPEVTEEPEPEVEAEPEVTEEPEEEAEAEPEAEVETEAEVTEEPEAEVETEPEVTEESEAEVEAEPEVTEEPEAEVETEPEVTAEPEAEVETEPEITEEPVAEVEAEENLEADQKVSVVPKDIEKKSVGEGNGQEPRRLEDLSWDDIQTMSQTYKGREELERLNADFRERYEAEMFNMSQEEYREYKEQRDFRTHSELKEITANKEETAYQLEGYKADLEVAKKNTADRFEAVMSCDRGTEEYKNALTEYNYSKDHKEELQEKVDTLQKQYDALDSRSMRLREHHLEKGKEAVECSEESIAKAERLQEEFDRCYYGRKPKTKDLDRIQEDSAELISELQDEKDAIRFAMDAKMAEIREHVNANNIGRYNTDRFPHYQELIGEYQELEKRYQQVGYHIVKLDENNISSSALTGTNYESIRYKQPNTIPEVVNGKDVPGETDYFRETDKVREALEPFQQEKWENLSFLEQKEAIERLANYNAEVLGIENPPAIRYYNENDRTDFGGYSASEHTIFINAFNMNDAKETADTISHEYRHCYQHERANKLETERDLEFKEEFDNYIRPENDYAGYLNQLVESDARAYADEVKKKIDSFKTPDVLTDISENAKTGSPKSYESLNPEKGAVFDVVEKNQLPDDFEKKIVEVNEHREIFEAKELQEIKAQIEPIYENGATIAEKVPEFDTYKEHREIEGGHIGKVHDKTLEAADVLEKSFAENNYQGVYSDRIDRKSLEMMALYHDTGMDGNIELEDFDEAKQRFLNNPEKKASYIKEQMEKGKTEEEAIEKFEKEGFESQFRKEHSVQSAIHVLRDRKFIEGKGVNADKVALGCLAHSKTNSGVRNLADNDQWEAAIDRLQNAVKEFNLNHKEEEWINFDDSFLKNTDGSFNDASLAQMKSESLCLRIGDANGHDSKSRISQNGREINFSLDAYKKNDIAIPDDIAAKISKGDLPSYYSEIQRSDVVVGGVPLDNENDKSGMARMFAVGEGNFKSVDLVFKDTEPTQIFELENPDAFPESTQFCIEERLKEYNTAKIMEEIDPDVSKGVRPPGMSDAKWKKKVENSNQIEKIKFDTEINLSGCDKETIESYKKFAKDMKRKYRINVSLKIKE